MNIAISNSFISFLSGIGLTILLCFYSTTSVAQEAPVVEWTKTIDGPQLTDYAEEVTVDADGNVYSIGSFYTEADFDPGPGEFIMTTIPGSWEGFVLKLDSDGNFIWAKKLPRGLSFNRSIDIDAAGNLIIAGNFYGTVDFDPGAGVFNLTSNGGNDDFYILKLNAGGNFIWAVSVGSTFSDNVRDVKVDPSGNIYASGNFRGTVDFNPGVGVFNLTSSFNNTFILKLDANSNFLWARSFVNSMGNQATSLDLDGTAGVYCAGTFSGATDFDPGAGTFNITSAGGTDSYITKLDASGNFIWAKSIGGGATLRINEITQDASGSILATGIYTGTCDFDPGAGVTNYTAVVGTGDLFILKLNSSGDFVWAKVIGGSSSEEGFGIACDAAGNVYTTGSFFSGTVDFDPGPGVFNLTSAGFEDIFLSKLDPSGNMVWTIRMGGTGGGSGYADRGESLKIDAAGTIYLSGRFANGVDFDPGTCTDIRSAKAASDPFIQKIKLGTVSLPPTITSFTPTTGPIGTPVVITGTNFSTTPASNAVTFFNNRAATVSGSTTTTINTTVPASSVTGRISVTVNCVTVQSATNFIVGAAPVPTITSFTPTSGPVGTTVIITGTNFSSTPSANTVNFNGTAATVTASTSTSITTTVPSSASTGKITVTVAGNTATSVSDFTVTTPVGLTITSQPVNFPACPGDVATFSTTATGTTNITYRWQIEDDGIFTDINNGNGYSGASTSTLSINTNQNNGIGIFRCRINGDGASQVVTNEVSIIINQNCGSNEPPVIQPGTGAAQVGGIVRLDLTSLISDPDDNLDASTLQLVSNVSEQGASASLSDWELTLDYNGIIFLGVDRISIAICDLAAACTEQELSIEVSGDISVFNAISPNGDSKNEVFIIQSIDVLPDANKNRVTILNRWGDVVFEVSNYNNTDRVFKGIGNNGQELSTGTYFYKIEFSSGRKTQTGYLSLMR